MPDDGWSEPWPRRDDDELGVWTAFVQSLDPVELERERMRAPADPRAERFGSRQHHETMHAHEYVAEQLRWDRTELDAMIKRTGLPPERAALRVLDERRENQTHHTRGSAA